MSDNERVDWDMHRTPLTNIVIIHKMQLDQPLPQDVVGPTTSCGRSHTDGTFLSLCVFKWQQLLSLLSYVKKKWLDPPLYDYEEEGRQLLFIKFYFGKYFTHLNFASPSEILIILVLWLKLSFNGVSCDTMWRLQKHQIHTCDKVDIVVGRGAIVGSSYSGPVYTCRWPACHAI